MKKPLLKKSPPVINSFCQRTPWCEEEICRCREYEEQQNRTISQIEYQLHLSNEYLKKAKKYSRRAGICIALAIIVITINIIIIASQ